MASQVILGTKGILARSGDVTSSALPFPRTEGRSNPQLLRRFASILSSLPLWMWAFLDSVLLGIGAYVGYHQFVIDKCPPFAHVPGWQGFCTLASSFLFASLVYGLYERETLLSRSRLLTRMMLTTTTAVVITYAIIYVVMYTTLSRRVTGMALGSLMIFGGSARLVAYWALHRIPRNIVIVGPGIISNSLVRAFKDGFLSEHRLIGYVDDTAAAGATIDETLCLGNTGNLSDICTRYEIDDIVVGAEAATDARVMERVLPCLRQGCRVTNEAMFYEKATGQVLVDEITPHWFLFADLQVHCQRRQALKRAFDVVLSIVGILITMIALPIIALAIKLCDGGPVFYSQLRVGQNGRHFRLFKFRTMKVGAETNRPLWAAKDDPRVTRVGRWLRKTRIDELPQLYNVLIGQMSLVGPRPERPDFVVQLSKHIPYYNERHLVKPGITGWAQIGFRYGSSIEDAKRKLQFDLYYIKNMSMELEFVILLRTLGVFVRGAC